MYFAYEAGYTRFDDRTITLSVGLTVHKNHCASRASKSDVEKSAFLPQLFRHPRSRWKNLLHKFWYYDGTKLPSFAAVVRG